MDLKTDLMTFHIPVDHHKGLEALLDFGEKLGVSEEHMLGMVIVAGLNVISNSISDMGDISTSDVEIARLQLLEAIKTAKTIL